MMQSEVAATAFVPPLSPLVLLAFLGTGFLLAGLGLAAVLSAAARRRRLAAGLALAAGAAAAAYAVLLFAAAAISRDRVLPPGGRKYFCEMDCHIAYSVVAASSPEPTRRVVTVRAWFDPATTSPHRGDGPLAPNPRVVLLVDAAGRRIAPSPGATLAWEAMHGPTGPLDRPLRPGEQSITTFVFDVPVRLEAPRLLLADPPGLETLLIGHENSPGHGKTFLALPG